MDRKTQAEVLLNAYSRELERKRLAAGAKGLLISGETDMVISKIGMMFIFLIDEDDDGDNDNDNDSDEEFHYPGSSPTGTLRAQSILSNTTDYFMRPGMARAPTDLTPHLSQAPEFRVPTHEAPQKILTPRWTAPTPHQVNATWERDDAVNECRDCHRRFNFLNRRVRLLFVILCFHLF